MQWLFASQLPYRVYQLLLGRQYTRLRCSGMLSIGAGMTGYFLDTLNPIERLIMIASGLLLLIPGWWTDAIGGVVLAAIILLQLYRRKKMAKTPEESESYAKTAKFIRITALALVAVGMVAGGLWFFTGYVEDPISAEGITFTKDGVKSVYLYVSEDMAAHISPGTTLELTPDFATEKNGSLPATVTEVDTSVGGVDMIQRGWKMLLGLDADPAAVLLDTQGDDLVRITIVPNTIVDKLQWTGSAEVGWVDGQRCTATILAEHRHPYQALFQ